MTLHYQVQRLWSRLQLLVGHGRIHLVNDAGDAQTCQAEFAGSDLRDDMPRIMEYGFSSSPQPGCQAIVLFVGGDRSNGAIVGTNDGASRFKNLQPGEVVIYDDLGQFIHLTRSGIVINGGGLPISFVNTPSITHDGVSIGKTHAHSGVTAGSSNTGAPV